MELEINPRTMDQILILDCTGRMVSGEDLDSVKEAVKQLVSTTSAVVVNLDTVSYVDSEGLGVLVGIHTSVRNRRVQRTQYQRPCRVCDGEFRWRRQRIGTRHSA